VFLFMTSEGGEGGRGGIVIPSRDERKTSDREGGKKERNSSIHSWRGGGKRGEKNDISLLLITSLRNEGGKESKSHKGEKEEEKGRE